MNVDPRYLPREQAGCWRYGIRWHRCSHAIGSYNLIVRYRSLKIYRLITRRYELMMDVALYCTTLLSLSLSDMDRRRLSLRDRRMLNYTNRLKSYETWSLSLMDKNEMVIAGFYYTGIGDTVRCPFCGVEIGYWRFGDNPSLTIKVGVLNATSSTERFLPHRTPP
jgi:hypothetical protein